MGGVTVKTPLVSVCIPTYNRASMLSGCIEGVLRQTMPDFELIVCDNCSEDGTESLVRSFADTRIRYLRNARNLGVRENWRRSLQLATGRFVTIFPDDDLMMPENLERKARVLAEDREIGLVHSKYHVIDAAGQVIRENTNWGHGAERTADGMEASAELLAAQWNTINAPTVMFRRECFEKIGGFTDKLNFSLDWEYWMRIAVYYKVFFLADPLVKWRVHAGSCTSHSIGIDQRLKLEEDLLAKKLVADGHLRALPGFGPTRKLIWQRMAERFAEVIAPEPVDGNRRPDTLSFALVTLAKYPQLLRSPCALKAVVKCLLGGRKASSAGQDP